MANPDLPRGTVAFLFTDLESSTRLWQQHTEATRAAYARHDTILREAVANHQGVVYKVVGDAVQAAFPSVPDAVTAAVVAQRELVAEPWSETGLPEPLRIRMALHVGAVDPNSDGDYRSPVLNRLGRLLAAGHGGQILLTEATTALARDVLPPDVTITDLGAHRFKDLLDAERVFQLSGVGLPSDFPPLKSLGARPNNLPIQPTPLIGREREVAEVTELLRRPEVRLVTLTGPGGIGKTRLSLQVAAELADEWADGVWFVPLAPVSDPAMVPSAIANTVSLHERGDRPSLDLLRDELRAKELLLVLDNFEQVTNAASVIADLLSACPGLNVLVSSRIPLRLRVEHEYEVPPLGLPRRKPPPTPAQLTQFEAVRLFIERAQAVRSDFAVTNESAPAIAEICHRLDGLPLAIELAAARVKLLPPAAMLSRLEKRLQLLAGGARDLPERQRTLRAAIAWSYDLLTSSEQALFRRLAVFTGGCTLDAVEAVANPDLELDVFEGLALLVDHSLLRQVEERDGEPRFVMLETIREYARERLEEAGEAEATRDRHAAHFVAYADAIMEAEWEDRFSWEVTLARLRPEHDNLVSALEWSFDRSDPEVPLRLVSAAWQIWEQRGYLTEARPWAERALARDPRPTAARGHVLICIAVTARDAHDYERSMALLEESLRIFESIGNPFGASKAKSNLATSAADSGDPQRAIKLYEDVVEAGRRLGLARRTTINLSNLASVYTDLNEFERAEALLQESLALAESLQDTEAEAHALLNLGELAGRRGDQVEALILGRQSLEKWWRLEDHWGVVHSFHALALALTDREPVAAARLFGMDEALRATTGFSLAATFQEDHDHAVSGLRATLGEAKFASAWAAGSNLSLEEAVAEALAVAKAAVPDVVTTKIIN